MRKLLLLLCALFFLQLGYGQLTGVKTIPGDYSTIQAAIADLNALGVGSGGVTFNVAAGHTETFSATTAGLITATGTAANPIVFQKSGAGANPVITAATPGIGTMDYVICFSGTDYATFDGINIQENAANTSSTMQMEWAYAVLKSSETNGSQNNTIKNCAITLNAANTTSYAIYSNNHTPASTTQLVIANITGTNSFNKFFGLTISNTFNGFYFYGRGDAAPYTYYDQGNEIGVGGPNTINGLGVASGTATTYGFYGYYQNGIKIANNNFTGTCANTTGSVYAFYLLTATNANVDVYGNTISMNYMGTGSFYGIYCSGFGSSGTTNTVNFYNNSIINNSIPNFTSGTIYCIYISTGGVTANFYGNNVSGNTFGSASATATGTIYYTYFASSPTTAGIANMYNNTISNNARVQSVLGGGTTYIFYNGGAGNVFNEYNNTITNITIGSNGTTYGLYNLFSGVTKNVHHNTFSNILNANTSIYCLYNGNGTGAGYFYDNKIQNVTMNSAAGTIYGVYQSSGVNQYYYNNYISELFAPVATANPAIYGMYLSGATTLGAMNNTMVLNASSTSSTFGTVGIYASTSPDITLRNNIVVNNSTPGATGRVVAYQRSSTTIATYTSVSNNNDFYSGTPSATRLIYYDGTNSDQTLAAYKARVSPRDASSVTEMPPFVNSVTMPYDLHIQTTVPSQCESGGATVSTPVNIIDDYDGNPRYPNAGYPVNANSPATAPDIGADEFGGLLLDITSPNIAFAPFANTSSFGIRTLIATITDASGLPIAGIGLPVLYWKINSGSFIPVQATYLGSSQYSFTFGSGVLLNDVVYYYIVAQDNVTPIPNIGSNPSGGASGFTYNPPACSTPPTTPYSYQIVGSMCGNYNVGTGQTYATITAAIADINLKEIICPVTLTLTDASYSASETFPLVINTIAGSSAVNTVTIKPAPGVFPVISGSSTTSIIKLNGTQNLIIDGSNSGGTTRDLTILNTVASGTTAVVWLGSIGPGLGASNNIIKNCVISNGFNVSTSYGVFIGSATGIGTAGPDNHNVTIQNNLISKSYYGIYAAGTTSGLFNNLNILNNTLGSAVVSDYIGYYAIYLNGANMPVVKGNEVYNMITSAATNQTAVWLNGDLISPLVEGNKIHDLQNNNTGGWGAWGINVNAASVTGAIIQNNVIYNITTINYSTSSTTYNPFGIRLVAGAGHKIYHNTVHLTGTQFNSGTTGTLSACLLLTASSVTGLDIRDNIFTNNLEGLAGSVSYCVYAPAGTTFSTINYNDYYAYGTYGILGFLGANQTTLAGWQTATGQDASSVVINPVYVSTTNLHPTNTALDNLGFYFSSIPKDFDGLTRTSPPDMGAYEFGINPAVSTFEASGVSCDGGSLNGIINANGLIVNSYFDYGPTTAYGNSIAGVPATVTGSTDVAISVFLSMPSGTTYHYRLRGVTSGGVSVFGTDMVITTTATGAPLATTQPATNIGANTVTVNGLVNALCATTTVTFEYGTTISYGFTATAAQSPVSGGNNTAVNANLTGLIVNQIYHYRVKAESVNGITYGNDLTFTTGANPPTVITNPASNIGVSTATLNGSVNANGQNATVWFEYGMTMAYGTPATATPSTVTGNSPTAVIANISGLSPNTIYHYRCVGQNIGGTIYGNDMTFNTVCPLPAEPGAITGPTSVCQLSTGHVYSVAPIAYATGYVWTLPPGGAIVGGNNTNSITVDYGSAAESGNVSVNGTSVCGSGPVSSLAVTVYEDPIPVISGPYVACITNTYTYSTESGMSSYSWTVSSGGQILSGSGTSSISVRWNNSGAQSVSVSYTNVAGCPAPYPTVLNVNVGTLPSPSISGSNKVCVNEGLHVYTTETGFYGYTWGVPSGGTIVSGQGTYQVEVSWTGAGNRTVNVNYATISGCFATSPTVFAVEVMPVPVAPGAISGTHDLCAGTTGVSYSVAPVPDANDYYWQLPAGATIVSGENTNSIIVDFATDAASGDIRVQAENYCGIGPWSQPFDVTVNPIPPAPVASADEFYMLHSSAPEGNQWYFEGVMIDGATGQDYQATEEGLYWTVVTLEGCVSEASNQVDIIFVGIGEQNGTGFMIFPIPNDGRFNASISINGEDTFTISVYSDLGVKVYEKIDFHVDGKAQLPIDLNNPGKGVYTVIFKGNDQTVTRKVLVTK
jgi:trimeric autotransporter adhesin